MKDFANLSSVLKLRIFMNFLGGLCFSTVGTSMTVYYNQYIGAGLTGVLLMVSSILVFFAGIYSGHLTDKFGRRPLMLASTIVTTLGGALAAFANSPALFNPWLTYFGFLILDFGFGFFNTASSAMLVDLTQPGNRKTVYSILYWVSNLAILFGSALSGWFFRDYLFELLLAITAEEFISFLLVLFLIPESVDMSKSIVKHEGFFHSYRAVVKDHPFMLFCFASIFSSMIFSQTDYFLPVHLTDSFVTTHVFGIEIYGQRMLSLILIINTVLIVLFMGLLTKVTNKWPLKIAIALGTIVQGLGIIIAFIGHDFTVEVIAAITMTIGEMVLVPPSQALRADLMDGDRIGTYSGVYSITQPVASVLCGLMVSGTSLLGDYGESIILAIVIVLAVVPTMMAITRSRARMDRHLYNE
jgi:DHA1 family multidrug resistance protein B-like MFS transporter